MVLGLRFAAPAGDFELAAVPASAAGPELRRLLVGSEGALGVIDELTLRLRPAPRECIYEGVFFTDFAAGVEALIRTSAGGAGGEPEEPSVSECETTRVSG